MDGSLTNSLVYEVMYFAECRQWGALDISDLVQGRWQALSTNDLMTNSHHTVAERVLVMQSVNATYVVKRVRKSFSVASLVKDGRALLEILLSGVKIMPPMQMMHTVGPLPMQKESLNSSMHSHKSFPKEKSWLLQSTFCIFHSSMI